MIDLPAEMAREHAHSLRREAEATHLASVVRCCRPSNWRAGAKSAAGHLPHTLSATRRWLDHGQLGAGYLAPADDKPGAGWRYWRHNSS